MIYTEMTQKAINLAFAAHGTTPGKDGIPYVAHPLHVAEGAETEEETIVALLHDVAEDTDVTLDQIRAVGFSDSVMEALALLTHDKSEPYLEYVSRVRENELARKVKILDMRHNMDMTRLAGLPEADRQRLESKYRKAWLLLTDDSADTETGGISVPGK